MKIKIKRLDKDLPLPKYAHQGDAGCDLFSTIDKEINPNERALISTGIAVSIPQGYAAFVQPRSGLAVKHGISIVNTPGLIDSHYRGEIKVIIINTDPQASFVLKKGDKIAQMVIQKVENAEFEEVEELDKTERGAGGFGSTGISTIKL
ncbi:MAG: dUTP diphosphatase [Actinobacteria bacterium]|nr:MAG: dUTP diphosphatase [Actinomycetota bacterium]